MWLQDVCYSTKVINPENKGGYVAEDWKAQKFQDLEAMKGALASKFSQYIPDDGFQFGYLSPGHGFKGKQFTLSSNDDLKTMYQEYNGRKSINLWLKPNFGKKRPTSCLESDADTSMASQTKKKSRAESQLDKMDELQKIVAKLKERHKETKYSSFTQAQFHCWASTIQLGKHHSYEDPPSKPFFGSKTSSAPSGASPGKRIRMRSECIDQLTKWHKLLEAGVVSKNEYASLHGTIMCDIKKC